MSAVEVFPPDLSADFELHSGLHIGYVYGDSQIPSNASHYNRKFVPGARLPHVWLRTKPDIEWMHWMTPIDSSYVVELSEEETRQRRWSVLDICSYDAFTLFVDRSTAQSWKEVISRMKESLPRGLKINVGVLGEDFEILAGEKGDEWLRRMQLTAGGAVLVRPDQHILALMDNVDENMVIETVKTHLGLL